MQIKLSGLGGWIELTRDLLNNLPLAITEIKYDGVQYSRINNEWYRVHGKVYQSLKSSEITADQVKAPKRYSKTRRTLTRHSGWNPGMIEAFRDTYHDGSYLVTTRDGSRIYKNKAGQIHREGDEPAVAYHSGEFSWWNRGRKHRIGWPAVIKANGEEQYWVDGQRVG